MGLVCVFGEDKAEDAEGAIENGWRSSMNGWAGGQKNGKRREVTTSVRRDLNRVQHCVQ